MRFVHVGFRAINTLALLVTTAFLVDSSTLHALEPVLGGFAPWGLQRGVETEWTISGARLGDAEELLFHEPGFQAQAIEVLNDNAIKVRVAVDPNTRLGVHGIRIRTKTGVSNLRVFTVGLFSEVREVEPNNVFQKPQAIPLNTTVSGVVDSEDVDHFVIEAKAGERISCELEGIRLGISFFDPYLAILDEGRFELARSDDSSLLTQDGVCSVIAPKDGKYIVQVRECAFGGNGSCVYRLHVGTFPRPIAVYPPGGKVGEKLSLTWIGDVKGTFSSEQQLPDVPSSEYPISPAQNGETSPTPLHLRVSQLDYANEVEPNDGVAQATLAPAAPCAMHGVIGKSGDIDFFRFTARAGQQLDVRVIARNILRSPLDPVCVVYNAQGSGLVSNDDNGPNPDCYFRFAVPADGEYLISVHDHLRSGSEAHVYRVEITEAIPALTMLLPERFQYVPPTLVVPRSNRMAMMITGSRANYGGAVSLEFRDLAAGVHVTQQEMTADRADVPVVFGADPEAARGGLVSLLGKSLLDPNDPTKVVLGEISQRCVLIRGDNNIDVYGFNATRMAAVVADEIPFRVDLIAPKAPIARNGSMDLKVKATRKDDFKAPIQVSLLYNPPGIGSSGSVVIPEGQNEAVIPLTANGGAAIGIWKLVVIGRAPHAGATAECSSDLTDLKITDQFYNFAFDKAAVEQGKETDLVIRVEKKLDFEGAAKAEILGLPAGATCEPIEFACGAEELVFKLKTKAAIRPGKFPYVCRTTFLTDSEPVIHTLGAGELRVDEPLPPKPMTEAAPAVVVAAPPPEPTAKRLSRLEQLRLDKQKQDQK